jgi:hypothetical protein
MRSNLSRIDSVGLPMKSTRNSITLLNSSDDSVLSSYKMRLLSKFA